LFVGHRRGEEMGDKTLGERVGDLEALVRRIEEDMQRLKSPYPRLDMSVPDLPKRGPGRPKRIEEE
jgi:hypothetical protein